MVTLVCVKGVSKPWRIADKTTKSRRCAAEYPAKHPADRICLVFRMNNKFVKTHKIFI
jgi:hypothetical protein